MELPLPQLSTLLIVRCMSVCGRYIPWFQREICSTSQRYRESDKSRRESSGIFHQGKNSIKLVDWMLIKEFIHFGLTSQDINNTSVPLSLKEALENVFCPQVEELISLLQQYADEWKDIPMLCQNSWTASIPTKSREGDHGFRISTHGAIEFSQGLQNHGEVWWSYRQFQCPSCAYPSYDWRVFGNKFVSEKLGLEREQYTTQISNYDNFSAIFDAIRRINTIIIDLDRDFWMYISMEYFKQKIKAGEVGSSAMPQKWIYRLWEQWGQPWHIQCNPPVPRTEITSEPLAAWFNRFDCASQCRRANRA